MDEIYRRSEERDLHYGYRIHEIESLLLRRAREMRPQGNQHNLGIALHGQQTWIGLEFQVFLTPYDELERMLDVLKPAPGEKFVDLGAGYGRMGLILHELFPGVL